MTQPGGHATVSGELHLLAWNANHKRITKLNIDIGNVVAFLI